MLGFWCRIDHKKTHNPAHFQFLDEMTLYQFSSAFFTALSQPESLDTNSARVLVVFIIHQLVPLKSLTGMSGSVPTCGS